MTDNEIIAKLEETTKDAARHQLETLLAILERNGGVGYLRPYLRSYPVPVDAATFRRAVPLSCYDDYADPICRMADKGLDHDQRFLSVDPLFWDKFHEAKIDPLF